MELVTKEKLPIVTLHDGVVTSVVVELRWPPVSVYSSTDSMNTINSRLSTIQQNNNHFQDHVDHQIVIYNIAI